MSRRQAYDLHVLVQRDAADQEQQSNVVEKRLGVVIRVRSDVPPCDYLPVLRRRLAEDSVNSSQNFNSSNIFETMCCLFRKILLMSFLVCNDSWYFISKVPIYKSYNCNLSLISVESKAIQPFFITETKLLPRLSLVTIFLSLQGWRCSWGRFFEFLGEFFTIFYETSIFWRYFLRQGWQNLFYPIFSYLQGSCMDFPYLDFL